MRCWEKFATDFRYSSSPPVAMSTTAPPAAPTIPIPASATDPTTSMGAVTMEVQLLRPKPNDISMRMLRK